MSKLWKAKLITFSLFFFSAFSSSLFANWSPYAICNNGDMVVDYRKESMFLERNQLVIREANTVNYLKTKLPRLTHMPYTHESIYLTEIFNNKNELVIPLGFSKKNEKYKENKHDISPLNLNEPLTPVPYQMGNDSTHEVIVSRISAGILVEFFDRQQHKIIADIFFENCERVNTDVDAYDPLDFWYVNHS